MVEEKNTENEIFSTLASLWDLKMYFDLQSLGMI